MRRKEQSSKGTKAQKKRSVKSVGEWIRGDLLKYIWGAFLLVFTPWITSFFRDIPWVLYSIFIAGYWGCASWIIWLIRKKMGNQRVFRSPWVHNIFLVGCTGVILRFGPSTPQIEELQGKISPGYGTNIVSLGGTHFIANEPDGVLFRDEDEPVLRVRHSDKRVYISAKIKDANGRTMAEIIDNAWAVQKGLGLEWNSNLDALEVRNRDGKVLLQFANCGGVLRFEADFVCRNGAAVCFQSVQVPPGSNAVPISPTGLAMFTYPSSQWPNNEIVPIFKYPASSYAGVCTGLARLKLMEHRDASAGFERYRFSMMQSFNICQPPGWMKKQSPAEK